jgi:hypothetical protein
VDSQRSGENERRGEGFRSTLLVGPVADGDEKQRSMYVTWQVPWGRGLLEPNAAIAWRALQHFPQNDTPFLRFTFDIFASKFCVPKVIALSSYSNKLFNGYFFIMYYTIYTID